MRQSQIPVPFAFHRDRGSPSKKRARMSIVSGASTEGAAKGLRDITNRSHLSFGDQGAVELVKSRQRKVLRDIAHFQRSIQEIEREIARVADVLLPAVTRETETTAGGVETMQDGLVQLRGSLAEAIARGEDFARNSAMEANNMQLQFAVRVQTLENELEERVFQERSKKVAELRAVEAMQPSEEVLSEMRELNRQLVDVTQRHTQLSTENKALVQSYEKDEALPTYEQFTAQKQSTLDDLMERQAKLLQEHESVHTTFEEASAQRTQLQAQLDEFQSKIGTCTAKIAQEEARRAELSSRLATVTAEHDTVNAATQQIMQQHHAIQSLDKIQSGKLQREQRLRTKLSFSINSINHTVPLVSFTPSSNVTDTSSMHPCHSVTPGLIHFQRHPLIRSLQELVQYEVLPVCELFAEKQERKMNVVYIASENKDTAAFKTALCAGLGVPSTQSQENTFKVETMPLEVVFTAVDSPDEIEQMQTALSTQDTHLYHMLTAEPTLLVCNHEHNCQGIHRVVKRARTLAVKTPPCSK